MPRISVIIPARDVVEYLPACLDDLRRQTFTDFEALVVDDGSVDGTPDVIDRVTRADGRFRALMAAGEGPSAARNLGLDHAQGHMIGFVDADDRVSPHFLERLNTSLERTGSALACGGVRRLKGFETTASGLHQRALGDAPRDATHIRQVPDLVYDTTVWNKLFSRELWEDAGIRFAEGRWINDIFPSLRAHVAAPRVDLLADVVYYWRMRAERSTSITGSKFHDPAAALKSLEDRFDALERSRRLLVDELGEPGVLARFDERVLWHDLWAYLALYTDASQAYREALVSLTSGFLSRHEVEPGRHRLGVFLHEVYQALQNTDLDRLDDLLEPRTCVIATGGAGRVQVRIRSERESQRGLFARGISRLRHGPNRPLPSDRLEATARIRRVELDPEATSSLRLVGEARIHDGRAPITGPWRVGLGLDAWKSPARIQGPDDPLEDGPSHDRHPMLAPGWRPFTISLDPTSVLDHPEVRRWQVRVRLLVDDVEVDAETSWTGQALRTLGGGRPLGPAVDVVATPGGPSGLQLRCEDAPLRLREVRPHDDGVYGLSFDAGDIPDLVWLQPPDGAPVWQTAVFERRGAQVTTVLPPRALPAIWRRLELWVRSGDVVVRVRALPGLPTTPLPSLPVGGGGDLHAVCRPTVRGRIVLEAAPRHLEVDDLSSVAEGTHSALTLSGRLTFALIGGESLEARCRWTGESFSAPIREADGRWTASLPWAGLRGETDGEVVPRRWTLHVVGPQADEHRVQVPTENRHRLPLTSGLDEIAARIEVGTASTSHLVVSPTVP